MCHKIVNLTCDLKIMSLFQNSLPKCKTPKTTIFPMHLFRSLTSTLSDNVEKLSISVQTDSPLTPINLIQNKSPAHSPARTPNFPLPSVPPTRDIIGFLMPPIVCLFMVTVIGMHSNKSLHIIQPNSNFPLQKNYPVLINCLQSPAL